MSEYHPTTSQFFRVKVFGNVLQLRNPGNSLPPRRKQPEFWFCPPPHTYSLQGFPLLPTCQGGGGLRFLICCLSISFVSSEWGWAPFKWEHNDTDSKQCSISNTGKDTKGAGSPTSTVDLCLPPPKRGPCLRWRTHRSTTRTTCHT